MNGEDLSVDAHQGTQEILMFDVYKVSESSPNAMSVSCNYFNGIDVNNHDDVYSHLYQVHVSPTPSAQTTKHVRITTVLTHVPRLVDKALIVEHKTTSPFADVQEEIQAIHFRSVEVKNILK